PEAHDRHAVLLEQAAGVVAEAGVQGLHLARRGVVGPQLEDARVHLPGLLVAPVRVGPVGREAQHAQAQHQGSDDKFHTLPPSGRWVVQRQKPRYFPAFTSLVRGLPMQKRCCRPRMNSRPSATAGVATTGSPTVLRASSSKAVAALNTYTLPS